jgi:hypothetical protein
MQPRAGVKTATKVRMYGGNATMIAIKTVTVVAMTETVVTTARAMTSSGKDQRLAGNSEQVFRLF